MLPPQHLVDDPTFRPVTRAWLANDLQALGVRPGGVLMVHLRLSALQYVIGGVDTVVAALLEAVGRDGTLVAFTGWEASPFHAPLLPSPWQAAYRSAAEALLRRFRKEDTLPTLHPLVDLCNAVSLAFALPVAVIDLDQVEGFIQVRHADGDEVSQAFSGEQEHPDPGEVIFADAARRVHARRWTFRQSKHSTVSDATRRALIVSEGLHAAAEADVTALLDTLVTTLQAAGFAPSRQAVLTAAAPRWDTGRTW
jgi:hypothetical protein